MKTRKVVSLLTAMLMTVGLITGCGTSDSQTVGSESTAETTETADSLNLLLWSGNGTDAQIQYIKEQTGIDVNVTTFTMLEEMLTKMVSGGIDYDVIMSGDYMISTMAQQGLLMELDHEILADQFANTDPSFLDKDYDPGNVYCIPTSGGQVGIMVNRDVITQDITSYADLWNPAFEGQIVILDDQRILTLSLIHI